MNTLHVLDALQICLEYSTSGQTETVSLQNAFGRVLAENTYAKEDIPAFDKSLMDGFAVHSADVSTACEHQPVLLEVIEQLPAGNWPTHTLKSLQTVRTMTGAPIIKRADAIIRMEEVVSKNAGQIGQSIAISSPISAGEAIQKKGEDFANGSLLYLVGTKLTSPEIAVLAAAGYFTVTVMKKPTICILSTGNELIDESAHKMPGQIYNSNAPMLKALLQEQGYNVLSIQTLPDEIDILHQAVPSLLAKTDILLSTGAISIGDYDFLPKVMQKANMNILFRQVNIKPGKPVTLAEKNGALWFALPGNPAAAYLTFHLFVLPALRKMEGQAYRSKWISAKLTKRPTDKKQSITTYWFGNASIQGETLCIEANQPQSSSKLSTIKDANAIIEVLPGNAPSIGDSVKILVTKEAFFR